MKKSLLIVILTFVMSNAYSQWEWNLPRPQGLDLRGIFFVNDNVGYSVGWGGVIVKTTDAGANWTVQQSNTEEILNNVYFTHPDTGYVVGASSIVLKTVDGGVTWVTLNISTIANFGDVHCITKDICFVVGSEGTILRTIDGGINWTTIASGTTNTFSDMTFTSSTVGYLVGEGSSLLKTTDGGLTWTSSTISGANSSGGLNGIYFVDANTGYTTGYSNSGRIFKTTDAGANWSYVSTPWTATTHTDICFASATVGYVVGLGGIVGKTTNGGTSWSLTDTFGGWNFALAKTSTKVFLAAVNGGLYSTTGTGWTNLSPNPRNMQWADATFIKNTDIGCVVGQNGSIFTTTNNGTTWTDKSIGTTEDFTASFFTDQNNGCVVGIGGIIYRTTNGGTSWTPVNTGGQSYDLFDVAFVNSTTGFATGGSVILKTTNSGASWSTYSGIISAYKIEFANTQIGYTSGGGYVYKTADGGASWNQIATPSFGEVFVINEDTTVVADGDIIAYTPDGGITWDTTSTNADFYNYTRVCYVSALVGYAIKDKTIYCTVNGGKGWVEQSSPSLKYNSHVYTDICFKDKNIGFAFSWFGIAMRTTNGGNACQNAMPTITSQPKDSTYCPGNQFLVRIQLNQYNTVLYEWKKDGNIIDADDFDVYRPSFQNSDQGSYVCRLHNACGELTTNTAVISAHTLPTVNAGVDVSVCYGNTYTLNATGNATTYSWLLGGASNGYVVDTYGSVYSYYDVIGEDANGCKNYDTLIITIDFDPDCGSTPPTAVLAQNSKASLFSVYPNPGKDIFQVSTSGRKGSLTVLNAQGIVIKLFPEIKNDFTISLSELPDGIYYLKFEDGERTFSEKVVVTP